MAFTKVAAAGINTSGTFVLQNINTSGIVTAGTVQVGAATTIHSGGIDLGSGSINSHNINSTGIITATGGFVGNITGTAVTATTATFTNATISGDLTVQGTTTTLDTTLTEVDKLEVGANNTTVGVAITQSGTGDILRLYDSATQVVTVKDGGSVGIGTESPHAKLEVSGGQNQTANQFTDLVSISANANNDGIGAEVQLNFGISPSHTAEANRKVRIQSITHAGNATPLVINPAGGSVGIGTDNPSTKLHLSSGTATQMMISNTSSSMSDGDTIGTIDFAAGPSNTVNARVAGAVEGTSEAGGDLVFETRADGGSLSEKLRITSGGQVNIGNSFTQTTWLTHIEGAYNKAGLKVASGAPGYSDPFVVATSTGGERFRITGDGYVGIGATNPGADPAVGNDANILEIRRTTTGSITSGNNRRGAVLRLKHEVNWENPYSGGDDVGRIEFATGDDSNGEGLRSVIRCEAVNYYNTNDLVFDVADYASATMRERLRIDSSGRVTIPYQPYARVYYRSATNLNYTTGNTYTVVFNSVDANVGSHYSTSNGRFTCPVAGTYLVMTALQFSVPSQSSWAYNVLIRVNNNTYAGVYQGTPSATAYESGEAYAIVNVSANDYIDIAVTVNSNIGHEVSPGDSRNYLMIYLLG